MSFLPRSFIIFALCIPLAILLGVMLAEPLDSGTLMLLGSCFLLLLSPFLLKHYHAALLVTWNAYVTVFFLPGRPYLWMLLTLIGFGLMILIRAINRDTMKFLYVPGVAIPLVLLGIIAYVTAHFTGGVGLFALGSDTFGGKKYLYIWFSIAAFFVLTSKSIPEDKVPLLSALFFLGGVTASFSNLAYILGPNFYFLFLLFPPDWGLGQAASEQMIGGFTRVTGLSPMSIALACFFLMRYGLEGILDLSKPWRLFAFGGVLLLGFYSGFRSVLVIVGLIIFFQFLTERLYKTKYLGIVLAGGVLAFGVLLAFSDRLPLPVQRSLTILPLKLDPAAVQDARATFDWRMEIWRLVSAEIPEYFWLGKGFSINPTDLYLAEESVKRGVYSAYEPAIIAGDYHSGPLSLLIPFGIFGALAFLWFLFASHRVLWQNYKYSPPGMLNLNQFLLAFFYARVVFYFAVFGAFYLDLGLFVGIVSLSICANAGVRVRAEEPVPIPQTDAPGNRDEWQEGAGVLPAYTR